MEKSAGQGDYRVICDRTGFKVWASDTRLEWNGLRVRKQDWEPRHPQDFVRGRRDRQIVADARPEATDSFETAYTWNDTTKSWDVS